MFGFVLTMGLIIFLGFALMMVKLPMWRICWLLGHSVKLDIAASAFAFVLGMGTMTGVMAAMVAGLLVGIATTMFRWLIGYTEYDKQKREYVYQPGKLNVYGSVINGS